MSQPYSNSIKMKCTWWLCWFCWRCILHKKVWKKMSQPYFRSVGSVATDGCSLFWPVFFWVSVVFFLGGCIFVCPFPLLIQFFCNLARNQDEMQLELQISSGKWFRNTINFFFSFFGCKATEKRLDGECEGRPKKVRSFRKRKKGRRIKATYGQVQLTYCKRFFKMNNITVFGTYRIQW